MKFSTATALALLFATTPVIATPKTLHLNVKKIKRDASAQSLARRSGSSSVQADLGNYEGLGLYALNVSVGTPAQQLTVQLDTGSSDFWVPVTGSNLCQLQTSLCDVLGSFDPSKSKSYKNVSDGFQIEYGDGTQITGDYGNDTVAFGGTTLQGAAVAIANDGQTQTPLSGIMGIGYDAGEAGVQLSGDKPYANIVAQLKQNGNINSMAYSLWLNDIGSSDGNILFGGVDTTKFVGSLTTLPVQPDDSGTFSRLMVAWTSLAFTSDGQNTDITSQDFPYLALMDSGTTTSALPDDLVEQIYDGLGVVEDDNYGALLPCSAGSDSSSAFTFGFSGAMINVSMSELLLPAIDEDNQPITFDDGSEACQFGLGGGAEDGLAILGDAFLRSAYVVYDLDNNQLGLAQTKFNVTDTDVQEISGSSIPSATAAASTVSAGEPTQTGVGATGGGVLGETHTATAASLGGFTGSPTFHMGTRTATAGSAPAATSSKSAAAGGAVMQGQGMEMAGLVAGMVAVLASFGGAAFLL